MRRAAADRLFVFPHEIQHVGQIRPVIPRAQKAKLQSILTAKGRSYSDLVYDENGRENADASRRVEFKFSLKDAEMIAEMNRILSQDASGGSQGE